MNTDVTKMEDKRTRQVTMSLLADTITEDEIEAVFDKWDVGIKGGAYALHDCDVYVPREVHHINKRIDRTIKSIMESKDSHTPDEIKELVEKEESKKVKEGDPKPAHYHIVLNFGKNAKTFGEVAKAFNTLPNMVERISGGMKGFASMLAYLTHKTAKAQEDGKYVYDNDIVQRLVFPQDRRFEDFYDYDDFIDAFINKEIEFDVTAKQVLEGKYTPNDIMEKDPEYYLKNTAMIQRARRAYVNNLPTPKFLFNYYIGTLDSEREGSKGRVGKGIASRTLAISLLASDYPDVDFSKMDDDDLVKNGYIYWAGGSGVALQDYDGQKVIIWDDTRGYDLIKIFGGVSKLFAAFDTRPKPIPLNIKYDKVYLKNSYNIVNGTQTYTEFINDLSVEFKEQTDQWGNKKNVKHTKEDKSQAKGRFPFFIEVTPSFVTVNAQMDYLIGTTKYNFRREFANDLQALAANSRIQEAADQLSENYIEAQSVVIKGLEKPEVPAIPMQELTGNKDEIIELAKKDGITLDKEVIEKIEADRRYQEDLKIYEKLKKYGIEFTDKEPIEVGNDYEYNTPEYWNERYQQWDEIKKELAKNGIHIDDKNMNRFNIDSQLCKIYNKIQEYKEKEHLEDLKQQYLHEKTLEAKENGQIIEAEVVPEGNEDN